VRRVPHFFSSFLHILCGASNRDAASDKLAMRLAYDATRSCVSNGTPHAVDDTVTTCLRLAIRCDDDSAYCVVCRSVGMRKFHGLSNCLTILCKHKRGSKYRVRQKYLTIWQNSCEWNLWRGEFVLERPSSETQSISVAIERCFVEHRAFAVETYFKNNDSVMTQRIFRLHFNIHRNECP